MNAVKAYDADATIEVFDSQGDAYRAAFQAFLDHTDQKDQARRWLDRLVESLPQRRVFIDAGAGNGKVTAWFVEQFERTIAIEPNPHLRSELSRVCPPVEVLGEGILDAKPAAAGDLVLCSHVFYYIDGAAWMPTLIKLASWLAPQGTLVVVIQNHQSDCMRMLDHFYGQRFNLQPRRKDVAQYLREHFADGDGGFRFSCDQDFLIVRPRA